MKSTQRIMFVAVPLTVFLVAHLSTQAVAQTTLVSQLATFDTAPVTPLVPGQDFDPQFDNTASCSGCWFGRPASSTSTYSRSTEHATQGSGSLKTSIVGKGAGGEYSVNINGSPVQLDTHFDYPFTATYSSNANINGGVVDPRFTALETAVDSGEQSLYNIEFDIIYDVAQMRSIPWQAPEETVDPGPNGENRYPQRFFWVGLFGGANDSFQFTGFDANTIAPFDAQYDSNLFPVFHASFPLSALNFIPNSTSTFYTLGILYNSVHGTLPASSNTVGATVYFDNFRLTKLNPVGPIDYNNNGQADPGDWQLFMAQYLVTNPPAPGANPALSFDLIGNFGAAGQNGVVDFSDLQKFQEFYSIANPGSAAVLFGTVPEPGTIALVGLTIAGLLIPRSRKWSQLTSIAAAIVVIALAQQTAQAQLVEGFDTIGRWVANAGAAAGANPSVALSPIGATQGTTALKITQAQDTTGDGDFSWNAATSPTWTTGDAAFNVLRNAVNIGAEHYNVLVDTTFRPADLFDQGVNSLTVYLGFDFNAQQIGQYSGETEQFTTTATIPLSAFDLPDVEDQGATSYSAQFAFVADGLQFPFAAYVDNIRLQQVSTPDLLTLEINRANGAATLKNLSPNPISWDYMEIKSAGGSLDVAGWNSLDEQNIDGANTWIQAGGSTANQLAEASLLGNHTLAPNATLSLGELWNEGVKIEDVDLEIRREGGPLFRTYDQLVTYIGTAPAGNIGDYNDDGVVNAADYTKWRDNLGGAGTTLLNRDPANTGLVGPADFNSWKANFGHVGGAGSLAAGAVPEPASLGLFAGVALVLGAVQRPRRGW
ncbi:MAG: PEP-CTERM sorting domain-containing protein [Pirellulales bacterium]